MITIKIVPETDEIETMREVDVEGANPPRKRNHYQLYTRDRKEDFIAYVEDPQYGGQAGAGEAAIAEMGW